MLESSPCCALEPVYTPVLLCMVHTPALRVQGLPKTRSGKIMRRVLRKIISQEVWYGCALVRAACGPTVSPRCLWGLRSTCRALQVQWCLLCPELYALREVARKYGAVCRCWCTCWLYVPALRDGAV
jgi:hypothetical protein